MVAYSWYFIVGAITGIVALFFAQRLDFVQELEDEDFFMFCMCWILKIISFFVFLIGWVLVLPMGAVVGVAWLFWNAKQNRKNKIQRQRPRRFARIKVDSEY